MKKNNIYDRAIKCYGVKNQVLKAVEELNELSTSLLHWTFNKENNVLEEIADVEIMIEQLKIIFRGSKQKIESSSKLFEKKM